MCVRLAGTGRARVGVGARCVREELGVLGDLQALAWRYSELVVPLVGIPPRRMPTRFIARSYEA